MPGAHVDRAVAELADDRLLLALAYEREREPGGERELAADDAPAAVVAALGVEQVHRAAAAVRAAVALAEQLGHDRLGRRAAREREAVRAVAGDEQVVLLHRVDHADAGRLLAGGEMAVAADPAPPCTGARPRSRRRGSAASARTSRAGRCGRVRWPRLRPPRRNRGAARGCAAPPAGRCVGGRAAAPRRRRRRGRRRPRRTLRCCSIISLEIAGDGHAQTADAVEVPARALADRPDGAVLGQVAERLVERVVEHVEGVEVVAVAGALLRAQDVLQRGDVVLGRELGGAAHARALERLADELRVGDRRASRCASRTCRAAARSRPAARRAGARAPRGSASGSRPAGRRARSPTAAGRARARRARSPRAARRTPARGRTWSSARAAASGRAGPCLEYLHTSAAARWQRRLRARLRSPSPITIEREGRPRWTKRRSTCRCGSSSRSSA